MALDTSIIKLLQSVQERAMLAQSVATDDTVHIASHVDMLLEVAAIVPFLCDIALCVDKENVTLRRELVRLARSK